jgi:hypothetical protein
VVVLAVAALAGGWLTGCTKTVGPVALAPTEAPSSAADRDELPDPLRSRRSLPAARSPSYPAIRSPSPGRARPSFDEAAAVPCAGSPTGEQVIAALRRVAGLLPTTGTVTVRTGPLCAGSWQYTVVEVAGREPLQALTRGEPGALTVVTAGTDVCTVEVRAAAPAGILARTLC